MADAAHNAAAGPDSPAWDGAAVTPDDNNDLTLVATRALYIGVAGNVKVDMSGGTALTFVGVQAGQVLPVRVDRVYATGTTATDIIALY